MGPWGSEYGLLLGGFACFGRMWELVRAFRAFWRFLEILGALGGVYELLLEAFACFGTLGELFGAFWSFWSLLEVFGAFGTLGVGI